VPRQGPSGYTRLVLRCFSSRAVWLFTLALPALSCDGSLRLVVVEQGGSGNLTLAGKGGDAGGSSSVLPTGGTVDEGGSTENPQAGNAGQPDENIGAAGGMPDVPSWDAPALYTASFVPYSFPEQYVRHLDGVGIIATVDMAVPQDREAASFDLVPGLYESKNDAGQICVSFRANGKIGTFFRHANSRVRLDPADTVPLFLADATFCQEPGMADPQTITFRSVNYPGRVIHLRNVSELWIDDVPDPMTPEFAAAASFYRTTALVETPTPGQ
jgi:Alpha-L-arabinofuranosidase B (ABFB) domain